VETVGPFASMADIVTAARAAAAPGDVILLSPGCASFGLFRDEFDRGARFRNVVAMHQAHGTVAESPSPVAMEEGLG
jgi:UDP-N-acetylmuramoylalanine-D-glutamate ligase